MEKGVVFNEISKQDAFNEENRKSVVAWMLYRSNVKLALTHRKPEGFLIFEIVQHRTLSLSQ